MLRTTHSVPAQFSRRPGGSQTPELTLACVLEAAVFGGHSPLIAARLRHLAGLLAASDTTGWFAEPVVPELTLWLDRYVRPEAERGGVWLSHVAVVTPNLRCDYSPS